MKKRIFTIISLLISTCTGCARKRISSAEAAEIIEEFNFQNYSYTMKIYNLSTDGSEDILYERKGMKTEDPYRQYEITTKDSPDREYELGSPYNAILLGLSDDPNKTINMDASTNVKFYIDKETKKVDRIRVLLLGFGRISEIQTLVAEGMAYEEARK